MSLMQHWRVKPCLCAHDKGILWVSRIYGGGANVVGRCTQCDEVFSNAELSFCYDQFKNVILKPNWKFLQ
jgi:hypothetical protein